MSTATKDPARVDPHLFLVAVETVRKQHGDAAVIGDPYLDAKGRRWAEVTKNGKYVDEVFLDSEPAANLDNLLGKHIECLNPKAPAPAPVSQPAPVAATRKG